MNSFIPAKTNAECGEQSWIEAAERVTIALNKVGFVCLFVVIQMVEGQSASCGLSFFLLWLQCFYPSSHCWPNGGLFFI